MNIPLFQPKRTSIHSHLYYHKSGILRRQKKTGNSLWATSFVNAKSGRCVIDDCFPRSDFPVSFLRIFSHQYLESRNFLSRKMTFTVYSGWRDLTLITDKNLHLAISLFAFRHIPPAPNGFQIVLFFDLFDLTHPQKH